MVVQAIERKPRNQHFKTASAWMISSGHREKGREVLPGFIFWTAATVKSTEILTGVAFCILQPSETFVTSRLDSRSAPRIFHF